MVRGRKQKNQSLLHSNKCKWNMHITSKPVGDADARSEEPEENVSNDEADDKTATDHSEEIMEGTFVAAVYENSPYIGKVVGMDATELEITYMESGSKVKNCLKWPVVEDKIWIPKANVICAVSEPQPTGKGKRLFKLSNADSQQVEGHSEKL